MLEEAVPVIGNTIHSIPSASSPGFDGDFPCSDHQDSSGFITKNSGLTNIITMAHVQEYFLLGATVYIGLKKWEDALLLLEMVLTSPTQNTATGFMLEAYRKWILVACLAYGRVRLAPSPESCPTLIF
jgi:COP9 signalosome complex subunit 3